MAVIQTSGTPPSVPVYGTFTGAQGNKNQILSNGTIQYQNNGEWLTREDGTWDFATNTIKRPGGNTSTWNPSDFTISTSPHRSGLINVQDPGNAAPYVAATTTTPSSIGTTNWTASQVGAPSAAAASNWTATQAGPAGQADVSSWDATQAGPIERANTVDWKIDQDQTVAGQIRRLLNEDSPVMQRAEGLALSQANRRGLLNSSIANTSALSAMIDSGLPIATADAGIYARAGEVNASQANENSRFNAGESNLTSRFNVGESNRALESNAREANATSRFNVGESNATSRFNVGEANRSLESNAGNQTQVSLANSRDANETARMNVAEQNRASSQNADQANANARALATLQQQAQQFNATSVNEASRFNSDWANKNYQQSAAISAELQKSAIDQANKIELANIEANYKTLMQTSSSASQVFSQSMSAITNILQDPNMDAASKTTAYNVIVNNMKTQLNMLGSINGVDLTDLLDFQTAE